MRVLVLLMLLSVVAAAAGCSSDDGGSKVNEDVAAMMKKMPRGTGMFAYFDVDALRSDNDLAPVAEAVMVYQFEEEDAADDALEEIEDGLKENAEGVDPDTVEIEQDGRYVKVAADVGMDAFSL